MLRVATPILAGIGGALFTACATTGSVVRDGNAVRLAAPEPVDGDDRTLAWRFGVSAEGTEEPLVGFRLRLDSGGTLVAVRPDTANPDPTVPGWTGEIVEGEAVWTGQPMTGTRQVWLTMFVRAPAPGDQQLQVQWARIRQRGAETAWLCERWIYRPAAGEIERAEC